MVMPLRCLGPFSNKDKKGFKTRKEAVVYTLTFAHSPTERKALLSCGSDDGLKAWVNGKPAIARDVYRAALPGQDKKLVKLRSGWNVIMLKIIQGGGGWEQYMQLLDPKTGKPLANVTYADTPPTPASDSE
jgi:hypothetical protein